MIETLYLVRHAFRATYSVDPETGTYTSLTTKTPTGIPNDPPLTSKGVEQAEQLASYLCNVQPPVDVVYSSPFYRCLQTLKPATDCLFRRGHVKERIRVDHGIGEFFGRAAWTHPHPPDVPTLNAHFAHLDQEHTSAYKPDPYGESLLELHERVRKALDNIVATLDNDSKAPKTALLCTHAAIMIAAGRVLTGLMPEDLDEDDFQCFTAGLSKYVRQDGNPGKGAAGEFACVMNSETCYLSGGPERGWRFAGDESFTPTKKAVTTDKDPSRL